MANEKDAMALAAVDSAAHALKYTGAKHEGVQQVIDARAHLASRIAELEAEGRVARVQAIIMASKYEAELAAVREDAKDAQHVIWLLLRSNGGALTISAQAARELDPGRAAIERTNAPSGEVTLRAIDAARGGE